MSLGIYYICYVDKKTHWGLNSVDHLYLMIHKLYGVVQEKNRNKYLIISYTYKNSEILKNYNQVFGGIKYHIKKINNNDSEYDKDNVKIRFNTDDGIPLNRKLNFVTVKVIIRCVLEKDGKYYLQVYLKNVCMKYKR